MANGTDELAPTATDYLGRQVPVAFRAQPALPAVGPPTAAAGPTTMGGQGFAEPGKAASASAKGDDGGATVLAQALKALGAGSRFADVAKKLFPKAGTETALGVGTAAKAGVDTFGGGGDLTLLSSERLTGPGIAQQRAILNELADKGFISQEELTTQLQGLDAVGAAPESLTSAESGATFGEGVPEVADFTGAASAVTGLITGLASRQGRSPPSTEEEAYLRMILDLGGAISAPVTLGFGPAIASALEFAIGDWFRPHIPHAVREARGESSAASTMQEYLRNIGRATSYEELYGAFGDDIQRIQGTIGNAPYFLGSGFDVTDPAAAMAAFRGDAPPTFAMQAGINVPVLEAINRAFNTGVADQIQLIRAADSGDPIAQKILAVLRSVNQHEHEAEAARQARGEFRFHPDLFFPPGAVPR